MREVTIILKGEPMSKQSVRGGKYGFYQPKEYKDREEDYRRQIQEQLPSDFVTFSKVVHVKRVLVVHGAIGKHRSSKKKRQALQDGLLIPKTTKPDLMDNLTKLPFDCMSEKSKIIQGKKVVLKRGVYVDDALIATASNLSKYYGLNPRIEIELKGE